MNDFEQMINKNYENFKNINNMIKVHCVLNPKKVGEAFGITNETSIINNLKDGRSISWWIEPSVVSFYNLKPNEDKNDLYDACLNIPNNKLIQNLLVGIKSLTKSGLDLQQSGFKGRGFKGLTIENRIESICTSIMLCDYHIITDIIDAPDIYFLPISSKELLLKYLLGSIKPGGIKRDVFYKIFFEKCLNQMLFDGDFELYKI